MLFYSVFISVLLACVLPPRRRLDVGFHGPAVIDVHELPCGNREQNPNPLQEHQVFLSAESSHHAECCIWYDKILSLFCSFHFLEHFTQSPHHWCPCLSWVPFSRTYPASSIFLLRFYACSFFWLFICLFPVERANPGLGDTGTHP